ncbi:unnamed protein product [Gordionus sp. m RMFG-2023]|uniref:zinc finger C4H2 domain-containing protein-like isoform X1 n=1 Tax=Gordionus sp. m RMFG-2023 TaxID=3053472 RepID=UPI0030E523B6
MSDKMEIYTKLECIKNARDKIKHMEFLKKKIFKFYEYYQQEGENIDEYNKEMEELYREKMFHVEELRLIHTDINLMELVLKQSNEHKTFCVYETKKLYDDLLYSQKILDDIKLSLGIESDLIKEIQDNISLNPKEAEMLQSLFQKHTLPIHDALANNLNCNQTFQNLHHSLSKKSQQNALSFVDSQNQTNNEYKSIKKSTISQCEEAYNNAISNFAKDISPHPTPSSTNTFEGTYTKSGLKIENTRNFLLDKLSLNPLNVDSKSSTSMFNASYTFNSLNGLGSSNMSGTGSSMNSLVGSGSYMRPSSSVAFFRNQQPPPMKTCLSCHQQIHRNAPICPLCKAKSRSRNPKKPKKKF